MQDYNSLAAEHHIGKPVQTGYSRPVIRKLVVTPRARAAFLNVHTENKLMRQHRNKHQSWEQKLNEKRLQPALLLWKTILLK